jgi:uncharacterized protein with HEPN domain
MIEAGEAALRYLAGVARENLEADDMRARAVVQAVGVIGEAASRLTSELRNRYPHVPWASIIGMRHRVVHGYFEIDYVRVWDTVTEQVPTMIAHAAQILAAEAETER